MRKITLLLILSFITCNLFAQRKTDLKTTILTPVNGQMYEDDDFLEIVIELKNLGPTDWIIGDTILWSTNFVQGEERGFLVPRTIVPNDTMLIAGKYRQLNALDTNVTLDFCFLANIKNGANPITDTNATAATGNNLDCKSITIKGKGPTSINDVNTITKSLAVYPNPANNEISFNAEAFTNKAFDIQVFDMTGRLVITQSYKGANNDQKIDIGHLNNGIYQIRISQDGNRFTGKFLKQ